MNIKIKKLHPDAVIPKYSKPGDAGLDLTAISKNFDTDGNYVYDTGLAFEIPSGYVGLLFPRSSNSSKDLVLSNSVGVIDSGFRGAVTMKFKSTFRYILFWWVLVILEKIGFNSYKVNVWNLWGNTYKIGDRIGQIIIIPYPAIEFEEVKELSETERGFGGYGSTGE